MTEAEWAELGRYIRWMANELGLKDWTLELKRDPPEDENLAEVDPCVGRKYAVIRVCSDFRERTPEDQRHTVIHELVHCHHVPATDMVRFELLKQLGQPTYDVFVASFKRQIEYMVDGLSESIAAKYPLIDWPKSSARK